MRSPNRLVAALPLVIAGVYACADSTKPMSRLSPVAPSFIRTRATDSLLTLSNVAYSDTAAALTRLTPLNQPISATAVIGPEGGSIKLDAAGGKIDVPAGALAAPTTITMTALAGANVAYEFQPHGLVFAVPVKVQQDLRVTAASTNPSLAGLAHGSYYDSSIDSSFVDVSKSLMRVKEHELGYLESNATQLKFYIGHFSGYVVTCGRDGGL